MPALHESIYSSTRAENFYGGLDNFLGAAGIFLSIFLDRIADKRGRSRLRVVQFSGRLNYLFVVITFWMSDLYVRIRTLHNKTVIALFHMCRQIS